MNKKITFLRLEKEGISLQKDPLEQVMLSKTEFLTFHFCLYGLEEDFTGGYYHGVLQLADDYPFSPPKIWYLTENGRFEVDKPICTTFTHYHKETWSSSWNIRTILTALISFMYSNQRGIGGLFYSSSRRKTLAKKSLKKNIANELFIDLFREQLIERNLISSEEMDVLSPLRKKNLDSCQIDKQSEEYDKTVVPDKLEEIVEAQQLIDPSPELVLPIEKSEQISQVDLQIQQKETVRMVEHPDVEEIGPKKKPHLIDTI